MNPRFFLETVIHTTNRSKYRSVSFQSDGNVKCTLPQPTTFETIYGRYSHTSRPQPKRRASLSARPNAGRDRASRDVIRDRERVLHERGRAARRRRLEAPRHLAETTRWCRASRNRERARRRGRVDRPRDARDRAETERGEAHSPRRRLEGVAGRPGGTFGPDASRHPTRAHPRKIRDRFPALFARDRGAPTDVARVLPRTRSCADRRSRAPSRSATVRGDAPRVSPRRTRGGRRRPPPIDSPRHARFTTLPQTTLGCANTAFFFFLFSSRETTR